MKRRGEKKLRARWEMTRTIRERKEHHHLAVTAAALLRRRAPEEISFCIMPERTNGERRCFAPEGEKNIGRNSIGERFLGRAYFSKRRARLLLSSYRSRSSDKRGAKINDNVQLTIIPVGACSIPLSRYRNRRPTFLSNLLSFTHAPGVMFASTL